MKILQNLKINEVLDLAVGKYNIYIEYKNLMEELTTMPNVQVISNTEVCDFKFMKIIWNDVELNIQNNFLGNCPENVYIITNSELLNLKINLEMYGKNSKNYRL